MISGIKFNLKTSKDASANGIKTLYNNPQNDNINNNTFNVIKDNSGSVSGIKIMDENETSDNLKEKYKKNNNFNNFDADNNEEISFNIYGLE